MTSKEEVKGILLDVLPHELVNPLIDEYGNVVSSFSAEQWREVIGGSGRFSELTLATIRYIRDSTVPNLDEMEFDPLFWDLIKTPGKSSATNELLYLSIPTNRHGVIYVA